MAKNNFDLYDYWQTVNTFSDVYYNEKRVADNYLLRKRKAELCALVQKVIKNELCEQDRLLVRLHWYKGKSKEEIAELVGLDRSSIYRRFEKINDIIYEKLKYAIEYRYDADFASKAKVLIKTDIKQSLLSSPTEKIGERLTALRKNQFLSLKELSELTSISTKRLEELEKHGKEMTVIELKKISSFYGVSTDYIIFGINDGRSPDICFENQN